MKNHKKEDISTTIYEQIFEVKIDDQNLNKLVKAVILDFPDGEVTVLNDNFGTRHKHMDFTKGKQKAGLHPLQICFAGMEDAIMFNHKFIGADDQIHHFRELQHDKSTD